VSAVNMSLSVLMFDTGEDAAAADYDYKAWPKMPAGVGIERAIIVRNGTTDGNATADLIMVDDKGNQYVTMITANLLGMLLSVLQNGPNPRSH
jgi:hypothetical protein